MNTKDKRITIAENELKGNAKRLKTKELCKRLKNKKIT
jgi:hypothetical protein